MKDYRSNTIKAHELEDVPTNPIFDGLPDELKDIECYESIEKDVAKIMLSDHKHRKVEVFAKCKRCQAKMDKRRAFIKDKGFKDYHQYVQWKKVMQFIKDNDLKVNE